MSELDINYDRFNAALAKVLTTSKRDVEVVMREQMRGIMRTVIGVTPPAHIVQSGDAGWRAVQGGKAKAHGSALVKSDILSIYGGPGALYDEIEKKEEFMAAAFWRHHKAGETERASAIARQVTGKGLYAFDGGKAHQNLKRGRRRGRSRTILFYVADSAPLNDYIKQIQARVGWLAAGWNEAAAALGIQPAQWILRHPSPGAVRVEVNENGIKITATNAVSYASATTDLNRRVQYAVDEQAAAMDRRLQNFLKQKFGTAGFAVITA